MLAPAAFAGYRVSAKSGIRFSNKSDAATTRWIASWRSIEPPAVAQGTPAA
jgi:hypothetical protein